MIALPNLATNNLWVIIPVFSTLFVFSGSRMVVGSAQITSTATSEERGSFLIINSSIQQLSTGIIAAVGGAIVYNDEARRVLNYPILGVIGVVLAVAAWLVFRKIKAKG